MAKLLKDILDLELWRYIFLPLPERKTVTVRCEEEEKVDGNYLINWSNDE